MSLYTRMVKLRAKLSVEPPAFRNKWIVRALVGIGILVFALAGFGGYPDSPGILRTAFVYRPLFLYLWGATLLIVLLFWMVKNPLEPTHPDARAQDAKKLDKLAIIKLSASLVVASLSIGMVGILVIRPDVVTSVLSRIARHFDTEAGKVVFNVVNFYVVIGFWADFLYRQVSIPLKSRVTEGRRLKSLRSDTTRDGTPSRTRSGSTTRPLVVAPATDGKERVYLDWSKSLEIAVDFMAFGVFMAGLSQLMRADVLNALIAQIRSSGFGSTSLLNTHISNCTVSWIGSRCTPGINPNRLPSLTIVDLEQAVLYVAIGLFFLGVELSARRFVHKAKEAEVKKPVVIAAGSTTFSIVSMNAPTDSAPMNTSAERMGEPMEQEEAMEEIVFDFPRALGRLWYAIVRSFRPLWPVALAMAAVCVAGAAHFSQLYLHLLNCQHQLQYDGHVKYCGAYQAAWFDNDVLNYRYLAWTIILPVGAALFVVAAVALLLFKWGPNLNQGLLDSGKGLNMLSYWLRILGHDAGLLLEPFVYFAGGLLLVNTFIAILFEAMLGRPPVPLPFAPPGVLVWFALLIYAGPGLIRWFVARVRMLVEKLRQSQPPAKASARK